MKGGNPLLALNSVCTSSVFMSQRDKKGEEKVEEKQLFDLLLIFLETLSGVEIRQKNEQEETKLREIVFCGLCNIV